MSLNKRVFQKSQASGGSVYIPEPNKLANLDANNSSSYGGSGTTITDLTGNGYNGTMGSGVSFNTSSTPYYFSFNGTSTGYIDIVNNPTSYTPNGNNVTFMGWFWFNDTGLKGIYNKGLSGTNYEMGLQFGNYGSFGYIGRLYRKSGSTTAIAVGNVTETSNVWLHIATTFNWSSNVLKVYQNGSVVAQDTTWNYQPTNALFNGITRIGNEIFNNGFAWAGRMAEFKIFSAALSDAEVLTSYNLNKSTYGH